MVQGGKLESCPSKTVKQMVDGFMGSPSWVSITADDGVNYVNISGDVTSKSFPGVTILLQFKLNKDKTFEYNALEFEGTAQTNEVAGGLLILMCEEGTGSSSEESSSLEDPDSSSALPVSDVLLDYKEFVKSGQELEVKGFLNTMGSITFLREDEFNTSAMLYLKVDGLERDDRKKIIKDGDDGFSVIVIGKAKDVMLQKGMIPTKIKY